MEGALLVGVGTGAMKPLLSKLSNLLEKEYAKLKGVRREVESTRAEMRSMKAALEALAEAEQLDPEMIEWRDEVRELSFDMEDCVDDFMARADSKQDGRKGLKGFFDKLKKLKPRHEIAGEIKELKARAIEASERHKRYKLDRSTPVSTTSGIDPRLHALYVEVGKLVGIEGPKKDIIDWFKNEGSSTQLRVVSIVGPGGLGKTTLGNAVFQIIKEEFSCKAFVSVSRKPNMKIVLKDIARRVGMAHDPSNDDEQWLIDSLRGHLQHKKYLIVIDDLWSTEAWKTIKDALLNNEHGSRIITTTRNSAVASFCSSEGDYVYRMEPLSSADSRRLFFGRAFRSEDLCPPHLKEVSERILKKCAGLPLAIITMSSLLADQTAEEVWNKALAVVGSSLAKEDGASDMKKILSLSYLDLPHYMRACLLYLSAYPEDGIIRKKSLIHKWMAEGFIREVEGQSTYEVGKAYFNDLINRSLIQPVGLNHFNDQELFGEVMACRVHDIIHDFITCKAKEENFMTSFGDAEHVGKHKVRRLSIMSRDNGMATVPGDLSHVRSLSVLGYAWQNFACDFPVLRVLDIERCRDLANIEKFLLLKYLRLGASCSIPEIPKEIGKLKYLETLDMRGVTVRKLPSTMTQLQRLSRLYANFQPVCFSDGIIGQLQSLEELEHVDVSETELEKFLQELGQLTKLRTLSVYVERSKLSRKVDNVRFLGTLISSSNLHHLTISYDADCATQCLLSLESWRPVNPVSLRKICIYDYSIDKVPNWMISLGNLSMLHLADIYCTGPEDIAILGGMPALVALKLTTWYGRNGKIFVRTGFRSLKYFSLAIYCCGTAVEFEEGSMPKLEHLGLAFEVHKEECVNYALDFGIQHLSALTKLDLRTGGNNDMIIHKLVETALGKFRHRPTLSWERLGDGVCSHFETCIKQEWEEEKEREIKEGEGGGPCSFLGLLLEEIKQDALPHMRVMGMLRSLDDLAKSLCSAASPAAAESAAVACAHSEIQREISSMDGRTKAVASRLLSAIACHLLASPAAAAAAPDDLFVHIAQDLVPHLASGRPHAVAEATRVLAASPSVAFPVLFKPLTSCLTAPDPRASIAAAAAFCELSAPPADVAPFLPLVPHICNLLTTSCCIWALISVLRVLARLVPLVESSLVVDPVCQLLTRSSDMFLTFQCIRTVLAARPAHGAILAIGKVKEFLSGARDSNLGLLALGMLYPGYANECRDVTALLLNDGFNSNIRREALHLLMEMVDGENIMGIVGMLVSHVAKSDSDPGSRMRFLVLF
uniref:Uncharacterized protein n=1 Tax=Avena sativa TaxID=4498 RepID=A0ACD5WQ80_AVESA